ncbi:hypothetical protein B0H11DRAFT_481758 [Mycena galericulata]|nr:hypothetical protein B0H11DRAFT_481758 [Mycena galericulata]
MSVAELEASIAQLSVEIFQCWRLGEFASLSTLVEADRQKEEQKILEQRRSDAQRQLNDIRDPVSRLPRELSSIIFIHCLPTFLSKPGALNVPMVFLNVCNTWADIARSIPALWDAIHVNFPRAQGFKELFGSWLDRAQTRPLSIALRGGDNVGVVAIIQEHAPQVEHLDVRSEDADTPKKRYPYDQGSSSTDDIIRCKLPALKSLAIQLTHIEIPGVFDLLSFFKYSSPPLQKLLLVNSDRKIDVGFTTPDEYLELLPTLVEFELQTTDTDAVDALFAALADPLSSLVPNLCRVKIRDAELSTESYERILGALAARPTRIRSLEVVLSYPNIGILPDSTIRHAFEQLRVANGVEIYVGTGQRNYAM